MSSDRDVARAALVLQRNGHGTYIDHEAARTAIDAVFREEHPDGVAGCGSPGILAKKLLDTLEKGGFATSRRAKRKEYTLAPGLPEKLWWRWFTEVYQHPVLGLTTRIVAPEWSPQGACLRFTPTDDGLGIQTTMPVMNAGWKLTGSSYGPVEQRKRGLLWVGERYMGRRAGRSLVLDTSTGALVLPFGVSQNEAQDAAKWVSDLLFEAERISR